MCTGMAALLLKSMHALLSMGMILQVLVICNWKTMDTGSSRHDSYAAFQCTRLRHKFLKMSSAKEIKVESLIRDVRELIMCPHTLNITHIEANRIRVKACCNVTHDMVLTQQNTALGQTVTCETERWIKQKIDKEIFNMLPPNSPWANLSIGSCALVGSGGILHNSSCGQQIDSHDYIIRFNMPPIGSSYSADVGNRTDMLTINLGQIRDGYPEMKKNARPLAKYLSAYGNAHILLAAFYQSYTIGLSFATHRALHPLRPNQSVLFFSPEFLLNLARYWRRRGLKPGRLSSGMMLVTIAMELCEELHLYGYWPFYLDLFEKPILYHYYDKLKPDTMQHSMPQEFLHLLQLHSQGALKLHIGPCTD